MGGKENAPAHRLTMQCKVCNREMTQRTEGQPIFQTDASPIPELCFACYTATVEIQKYVLRILDRGLWTLQAHRILKGILNDVKGNNA